jgi:hypothetical protein
MLALPLLFVTCASQAQDLAKLVRDTDLKDKPFIDAATLKSLPEALDVLVLSRKASWLEIQTDDLTGWVNLFSVRFDSQVQSKEGFFSGMQSLFNLTTTGSSNSSVTTASRGLDEAKFANPSPNPTAFTTMQTFTVSATEAQQFAQAQQLQPQQQEYVKRPGGKS